MNTLEEPDTAPILSGLRIVELSAFIAAPLCGLTLAQLGADVIRVDPPRGNIDFHRLPLSPSGHSLYWASLNRGKRSVEIDFRREEGRRLVRELLVNSGPDGGILVTNLPLDNALSYESLRVARPDLIMVHLSGSPDGRSELDYTVNCAVGFPMATGREGQAPVNHVLPAWDAIAGMTLATAVLAAERFRRRTGRGQRVTLALSDVAMAMASNLGYLAEVEINGTVRKPDGNYLYGAYGDAFRTADDRHVMLVAISNRQWSALLHALDMKAGVEAAAAALGLDLTSERGRYEAREFISACFRPWFAQRTLSEVEAGFGRHTLLWGVYRTFRQMVDEDPRCSVGNPIFRRVAHPGIGEFLTAGTPLAFGAAESVAPGVAPRLGQHTGAVLEEFTALQPADVAGLAAAGTIGEG